MTEANRLFHETRLVTPEGERLAREMDWKAHPSFPGVWMKHLVLGKDTGGLLSCHLVRVEPGKQIGAHVHEGSLELHEVLSGRGACRVEGREVAYSQGVSMVIAAGVDHAVQAHGEELCLMAKFAPALL